MDWSPSEVDLLLRLRRSYPAIGRPMPWAETQRLFEEEKRRRKWPHLRTENALKKKWGRLQTLLSRPSAQSVLPPTQDQAAIAMTQPDAQPARLDFGFGFPTRLHPTNGNGPPPILAGTVYRQILPDGNVRGEDVGQGPDSLAESIPSFDSNAQRVSVANVGAKLRC